MTTTNSAFLSLPISADRVTAETLKEIIERYFEKKELGELHLDEKKYKVFQNPPNAKPLVNIQITAYNIGRFHQAAQDHDVNYSLKKSEEEQRYYVCFQSNNGMSAIHRAMRAYVLQIEQETAKAIARERAIESVSGRKTAFLG